MLTSAGTGCVIATSITTLPGRLFFIWKVTDFIKLRNKHFVRILAFKLRLKKQLHKVMESKRAPLSN